MKALRIIVALGLSIGVLCGSTPSVWAGSGAGADCLTTNPGPSNTTLKGTMAVEVLDLGLALAGSTQVPVDAMLRLVKGGVVRFFYVSTLIQTGTNEQIACAVLGAMTGDLQSKFSLPATTAFCLTDKSLSSADPGPIPPLPSETVPLRLLSGADVTVYALPGPC